MPQTEVRTAAEQGARAHIFGSILVHVEPAHAATRRVGVASRLARDFGARLIGLGAETVDTLPTADPYSGYMSAEWVAIAFQQVEADLKLAEEAFRRDAGGAEIEWRSVQDFPARALARTARAADLIVMDGAGHGSASFRKADPADVVMSAGRPVLVLPEAGDELSGKAIVVAWKDTREARRAVADALPLLRRAEDVIVQAVCAADQVEAAAFQTNDVATALKRHGVAARSNVTTAPDEGVTPELERIADQNNADLIVAGAYGHSRLAEWAFGGVTRDLLWRPRHFVLLSH